MNITPRQHALLAAGLMAVAGGLFYFVLVWPTLAGRAAFQDHLERLQFQHRKLAETATLAPILEKELAALSGLEIDRSGFLGQKSRDLAAADLQRRLSVIIEEAGGSLISSQVLPAKNEGQNLFPEITMKVHMRGNIASFREVLEIFDTGQPLLFTDNLLVQKRQRSDEPARQGVDKLDIRFDATAFIYTPVE